MRNKQDMNALIQILKDKLMAIILLETAKDYKEMDSDLVTECVDFLMDLEETERLTETEIKQRINAIPFKSKITDINKHIKKKIRAKRLVIIAAIFAVLLAIFSIAAVSFTNAEDLLYDRYAHYLNEVMKPGEHKNFGNIELIKNNDSKVFESVEEFAEYENMEILFPTWLPEERTVSQIEYYYEEVLGGSYALWCGDPMYSISINVDKTVSEEVKEANRSEIVGEHTVYIIYTEDFVQGMFDYNGSYYSVSAYTEEDVLKIIENLKEIK